MSDERVEAAAEAIQGMGWFHKEDFPPLSFVDIAEVALAAADEAVGTRPDDDGHDWKAEAMGLGVMLTTIAADYAFAKRGLGGDSEILAAHIDGAERYVREVLWVAGSAQSESAP